MVALKGVMKTKFLEGFLTADRLKKAIMIGQVDIDTNLTGLRNLIDDLIVDMHIVDQNLKKEFENKQNSINNEIENKKKQLKDKTVIHDPIDQHNFDRKTEQYNLEQCTKELAVIEDIAYKEGWFD